MTESDIKIARTIPELRRHVTDWHQAGMTVALVPTMGALHKGHLSLVSEAQRHADRVVVSIFVNPGQFAAHEDLDTYPKDEAADLDKLTSLSVDLAYIPSAQEMYPDTFSTSIAVDDVSDGLCGDSRPHFFGGVATVVAKLFLQSQANFAVFGEKDYQQLTVIRRMVRDLDIPIEIIGAPTVRESDGLAMSSRNAYLTPEERKIAPQLHALLRSSANLLADGHATSKVLPKLQTRLEEVGFDVDYVAVRDAETLAPLDIIGTASARLFVAAILGKTRLIDNIAVVAN